MSAHLRSVPGGRPPRPSPECAVAEQKPDFADMHGWCAGPRVDPPVPWLPVLYCDCTCHADHTAAPAGGATPDG